MTQAIAPKTPARSQVEMRPTTSTRRYANAIANTQASTATRVPCVIVIARLAELDEPNLHVKACAATTFCNDGNMKPAYCATPTQPDAAESGELIINCHTYKNDSHRPALRGP